jgi:hypothetical protein
MNKVLIAILLMGFTTSIQASNVLQIWKCTTNEGSTGAEVEAVSAAWLKAVQGMKGGDQLEVYLEEPIAASEIGGNFYFVLVAPSFEVWGVFNDGYEGSPAQKADEEFSKVASCSSSTISLSTKVEVE